MRSAVAGASSLNMLSFSFDGPFFDFVASFLAASIAFLMAKNTDDARKSGGSPTALDEYTARGFDEPLSRLTLNSDGISPNPGILYAPGPFVKRRPVEGE